MKKFLLRPIRNDSELDEAIALADELVSRRADLVPEEVQYFDVLCYLIERYEDDQEPIPAVGGADMLRFLIEQRGLTQQAIAGEVGIANSTLSAVLTGSRDLTRGHIEKLATYFSVEPAVFLPAGK